MPLNLPTLAQLSAQRRATPKGQIETRLAEKTKDAKSDARAWNLVKREVWTREGGKDRYTKRTVEKTIALVPRRGEVHHIVSRADRAVRFDRRNLVLLSLETHEQVERNQLRIVGTKYFTVDGKRYIDSDYPLRFVKVTP